MTFASPVVDPKPSVTTVTTVTMVTVTIRELAVELCPPPERKVLKYRWRRDAPKGRPKDTLSRVARLYRHKAAVAETIPKLWEMVEYGYLQLLEPPDDPNDAGNVGQAVVVRPPTAVMDWLKVVFMPVSQRPTIGMDELKVILGVRDVSEIEIEAKRAGVVVTSDRALGRLVSMDGLLRLVEMMNSGGWKKYRKPFDRLRILGWLCGMEIGERVEKPYGLDMEREIGRIAKLKSPARAASAVELLVRYVDAAKLAEAVHGMDGIGGVVERDLGVLARLAFGVGHGDRVLKQILDNGGGEGDTGAVP